MRLFEFFDTLWCIFGKLKNPKNREFLRFQKIENSKILKKCSFVCVLWRFSTFLVLFLAIWSNWGCLGKASKIESRSWKSEKSRFSTLVLSRGCSLIDRWLRDAMTTESLLTLLRCFCALLMMCDACQQLFPLGW